MTAGLRTALLGMICVGLPESLAETN